MKFLIVSDIHGSESALDRVLEVFSSGSFDKVIICGDLLYHGARNDLPQGYNPKGVLAKLNGIKQTIIAVRGNCESEVDQMVLEFPVMADYSYYAAGSRTLFITHGHIYNPENLPPLNSGDIFLYGHTHLPEVREKEGVILFNPGSISIPKGGNEPTYGIIEDDVITINSLENHRVLANFKI